MLANLKKDLREVANPEKAAFFPRFFKAGPGEYAEGDEFLGVTVPNQRKIAKKYRDLPLKDVEKLVQSKWHEERLTGLFILVNAYEHGNAEFKKIIYDFYLSHTKDVNNWDLVDSSAHKIVGAQLENDPKKMEVLIKLAGSDSLWEKRIAMISTFYFINRGRADEAIVMAEMLLHDKHDLIQKAVGWMLRELGKKVDRDILVSFLDEHAHDMPRTTLRYAIEHFSEENRKYYLNLKAAGLY